MVKIQVRPTVNEHKVTDFSVSPIIFKGSSNLKPSTFFPPQKYDLISVQ